MQVLLQTVRGQASVYGMLKGFVIYGVLLIASSGAHTF
jgi:hypothetical protein